MKKMKRIFYSLLTCLLLLFAVPTAVNAAAKAPKCPKTQTLPIDKAYLTTMDKPVLTAAGNIYIQNLSKSAKITNVKSSNKNYTAMKATGLNAIVVYRSAQSQPDYQVKNGETTKLTFTVKQNGKSYRLSCKVTFKIQATVFKAFKIGSKNIASQIRGYYIRSYTNAPTSGKVKLQIQPAKNYKIDSIEVTYRNGASVTNKKVKNGAKISLKNAVSICVNYHTTVAPKYYKKPASNYKGTYKTPLHNSFTLRLF